MSFIGNNGLYYIMQVISKLLDPKTSEHTASFVGRLVSVVITKVGGRLGENLDMMLRLVLSKMQQAETLSVIMVWNGVGVACKKKLLSPYTALSSIMCSMCVSVVLNCWENRICAVERNCSLKERYIHIETKYAA